MQISLTGPGSPDKTQLPFLEQFTELARKNRAGISICDKPDRADLILYLYGASNLSRATPEQRALLCERPNDIYVFETSPLPVYGIQGIYHALDLKRAKNNRFRNYCSPVVHSHIEEMNKRNITPDFFFSFFGGSTSWVRKRLYFTKYKRRDILIKDSSYHHEWDRSQPDWEKNKREYVETIARSRFVLCPRGATPNAVRIYEGMECSRPVVLLSDAFPLPKGPDWGKFMIQVRERDIQHIPDILHPYENQWREMGIIARQEWEKWFAPEVWLERIVELCQDIAGKRRISEAEHLSQLAYSQAFQSIRNKTYQTTHMLTSSTLRRLGLGKILHLNRP